VSHLRTCDRCLVHFRCVPPARLCAGCHLKWAAELEHVFAAAEVLTERESERRFRRWCDTTRPQPVRRGVAP
jgi:hypothetical protein